MADRTMAQGLLLTNQLELAFSWLLSDLHVLVLDARHTGQANKALFQSQLQRSFPASTDVPWPGLGSEAELQGTSPSRCSCPTGHPCLGPLQDTVALFNRAEVLFPQGVREEERDEVPPADRPTRCHAKPSLLFRSWSALVSQCLDWL